MEVSREEILPRQIRESPIREVKGVWIMEERGPSDPGG